MRRMFWKGIKSIIALFAFLAVFQYMNNGTNNDDFTPMLYVFLAAVLIGSFRLFLRMRKKRAKVKQHA